MYNRQYLESFMKSALVEARQAALDSEVPVGAIVVLKDQIIGRGHNQREALNDPTAHAEIIAITAASNTISNWRLQNALLFVTKEPCPMCAGAIVNARIAHIIYGVEDEQAGCTGSLYQLCREPRFNHQAVVQGGILREECHGILTEFFKNRRINGGEEAE